MNIVILMLLGLLTLGTSLACFVEAQNRYAAPHERRRYIMPGIALCVLSVLFLSQAAIRLDALEAAKVAKEQK